VNPRPRAKQDRGLQNTHGRLPLTQMAQVVHLAGTRSAERERVRNHRSPFAAVLHAPQVLRALVRADEAWLVLLAAFVGPLAGWSCTS
jgi:hypothetical protein